MTKDILDPKGLIRESYRIAGITAPECRSIFLDWALGVPQAADMYDQIGQLLLNYAKDAPDHPMTKVLTEGLSAPAKSERRGGRRTRLMR